MEKDSRRWMVAAGLVGATVAVLFLRRPDQFLSPYIWVEDGTIVLPAFAARGWWSILEPVNGYLIMASKLITLSAFQISFGLAAHIALWLTVAFTTLVVLAVAFSPTHLRYKPLCALAVLLVPTDAEVFAVSEYAFWWAGILLILAVLWDGGRPWLRAGYVLLGGLSSPLIGPVAILLAIRAAWERCSTGMALAAMAVSLAALQAGVAYVTIHNSGAATLGLLAAHTAVDKLVGFFLFGSYTVHVGRFANLGFVILGAIAALVWHRREMLGRPFALLAALWAVG